MPLPTIIKRGDLGRRLTGSEVDSNFTNVSLAIGVLQDLVSGIGTGPQGEAMFTLTGGTGPDGSVQVGDVLTAALIEGIKGTIQFTRDGAPIAGAVNGTPASSLTYTVLAGDDTSLIAAQVSGLVFSVSGAYVGSGDDGLPPVLFSLLIAADSPNVIQFVYNKNLKNPPPAAAAFALGGTVATAKGVPTLSIVANILKLTYGNPFVYSDSPFQDYVVPGPNPISSSAGVAAAAVSQAVANQVAVPALVVYPYKANDGFEPARFSINKTTGDESLVADGNAYHGVYEQSVAAEADISLGERLQIYEGWMEMQVDALGSVVNFQEIDRGIGLRDHGGGSSANEVPYQVRQRAGTVYAGTPDSSPAGVGVTNYAFPNPSSVLNRARLRVSVAASGMFMDTSVDGGATWTQRFAWDGFSSVTPNGMYMWILLEDIVLKGVKAVGAERAA